MKKVKDHKKTESILPFLHNQRDSEKITQHRTTDSDKNHKDTKKTKRIQVIQQIKKSTIEKFKNLTKKSNFYVKTRPSYTIHPNTKQQQQINESLTISDQENNVTSITVSPLMNQQTVHSSHPALPHNQSIRRSPIITHTTEKYLQ